MCKLRSSAVSPRNQLKPRESTAALKGKVPKHANKKLEQRRRAELLQGTYAAGGIDEAAPRRDCGKTRTNKATHSCSTTCMTPNQCPPARDQNAPWPKYLHSQNQTQLLYFNHSTLRLQQMHLPSASVPSQTPLMPQALRSTRQPALARLPICLPDQIQLDPGSRT